MVKGGAVKNARKRKPASDIPNILRYSKVFQIHKCKKIFWCIFTPPWVAHVLVIHTSFIIWATFAILIQFIALPNNFEKMSCITLSTNQKCQTTGRRFPWATMIFDTSEPFCLIWLRGYEERTSSVAHPLLLDTLKYSKCIWRYLL